MYCKFMERNRYRHGVTDPQPNDFFADGAMEILNFELYTWRIAIRLSPCIANLWSVNVPATVPWNPSRTIYSPTVRCWF
jgi:hypothetical protein